MTLAPEPSATPEVSDPERAIALAYAGAARAPLAALFALDETLAGIVRRARQPLVGQMRLTWWHDSLTRLATAPPPAQPLLAALARDVLPRGVDPTVLATMIEGWEVLLDEGPPDDAALARHAEARGAGLFDGAATVLGAGPGDPVAAAGQGWALVDLAFHLSDAEAAARALDAARPFLDSIGAARWSVAGRPIGMLARLAAVDVRAGLGTPRRQGSPARLLRMLRHRLTGR